MVSFKYVSLFSGIGGFEVALNKLGGECVLSCEIDKYARQSYASIFWEKPFGDVTKLDAHTVPDHDLLVGGFPCQAFSIAGKRRGFEDTRGTLFFEAARIAKEKQPSVCLFENVKGLLSHDKGQTLSVILHTLNDIGYTIDINVMNSKYFGVPQNRERESLSLRSVMILHLHRIGGSVVRLSFKRQRKQMTTYVHSLLIGQVKKAYPCDSAIFWKAMSVRNII